MQKYDGVMDNATEFVGSYNAFDIHEPLTFTWLPYADKKGNTLYTPQRSLQRSDLYIIQCP